MTRKDVTENNANTFEELTETLLADGFAVNHYHGIDIDDKGEEWVTHISPDGENDRWHGRVLPTSWVRLVADG